MSGNPSPSYQQSWVHDAIVYQIFPDRFARTRSIATPTSIDQPWGSRPNATGFMGGTLRGMTQRLNYLADLGVNTLYLTPIFLASANHRYNTYDYYKIDPRLGTLKDFQRFLKAVHDRGMRLLLDGVFNHCGRGFFPFYDVMERGVVSSYASWFHIREFPVKAFGRFTYRGWQNRPLMPIVNLHNSKARQYFWDVVAYWTHQGIDGWRLDAVADVPGLTFWKGLWRTAKSINPSIYLVAELWANPKKWVKPGLFDGATNYPFRQLILEYCLFRSISTTQFFTRVERLFRVLPYLQQLTMVNVLGSHDTERIWTLANGNIPKIKLAIFFLFVCPGIPAIYYGDEIGLEGGKDPDNRRAMDWTRQTWNLELRSFTKTMIACRQSLAPLRAGDWASIIVIPALHISVFLRKTATSKVFILVSNNPDPLAVTLDVRPWLNKATCVLRDYVSGREWRCRRGVVTVNDIPPFSGMVLHQAASTKQVLPQ